MLKAFEYKTNFFNETIIFITYNASDRPCILVEACMLKNWKIIGILCLISSLVRFILDGYLPSLPAIGAYLQLSDASTQLTLTIYLLGFSISQVIYGPLSDRYGRKIILLIGLVIFTAGNLSCALSHSFTSLLLGRLAAGIGAGACGVLNRAIASDCFKGSEFSKAWSYTTTTVVFTLCIAPILGGYMQELSGWRANFVLATFFVSIVTLIIFKYLPETNSRIIHPESEKISLNLPAVLQNYCYILTKPSFITSTLCYTFSFAGLIIYFQLSPLLYIKQFGLSPSEYGWFALIIAGYYLIGGLVVNKFVVRFGTQKLLFFGILLLILGGLTLLITVLWIKINLWTVILSTGIYVIGARIVIPNAIAESLNGLRHLNGSSSALIGFIQMIGATLISLWAASYNHVSASLLAYFLTGLGLATLVMFLCGKVKSSVHEKVFESFTPPNDGRLG